MTIDEQPEALAKRSASKAVVINEWLTAYFGLPKEFLDPDDNSGFCETGEYCHVYNRQPFSADENTDTFKATIDDRFLCHSIPNEGVCIFQPDSAK